MLIEFAVGANAHLTSSTEQRTWPSRRVATLTFQIHCQDKRGSTQYTYETTLTDAQRHVLQLFDAHFGQPRGCRVEIKHREYAARAAAQSYKLLGS